MTLRTQDVKIDDSASRDFGKTYRVVEWDAYRAEWWAFRAFQAVAAAEVDIGALMQQAQVAEMARQGIGALAKVPAATAKPLLDEMMEGLLVVLPDGNTRPMRREDVSEVGTLLKLRMAIAEMHLGFFAQGGQ